MVYGVNMWYFIIEIKSKINKTKNHFMMNGSTDQIKSLQFFRVILTDKWTRKHRLPKCGQKQSSHVYNTEKHHRYSISSIYGFFLHDFGKINDANRTKTLKSTILERFLDILHIKRRYIQNSQRLRPMWQRVWQK